jgi:RNA polymerase sigma-70 factor (ECF subfamily)
MLLRLRNFQDVAAWRTFADVYGRLVYRYCRRRGLQEADAVDVTQEVLVQVSRSMPRFEYQPQRGRFRGWLATVTRNKLNRFWKRNLTTKQLCVEDAPATCDLTWDDEYHQMLLAAAVERTKPHFEPLTWQAFELVWFDELAAAETARRLKLPIERVYVAKSRVLKRLQQTVAEIADEWGDLSPPNVAPVPSGTELCESTH